MVLHLNQLISNQARIMVLYLHRLMLNQDHIICATSALAHAKIIIILGYYTWTNWYQSNSYHGAIPAPTDAKSGSYHGATSALARAKIITVSWYDSWTNGYQIKLISWCYTCTSWCQIGIIPWCHICTSSY